MVVTIQNKSDLSPEDLRKYREVNAEGNRILGEMNKDIPKEKFADLHSEVRRLYAPAFQRISDKSGGVPLQFNQLAKLVSESGDFPLCHLTSSLNEVFAEYHSWLAGEKVYGVHPNLCRRFSASHIKEIPIELFRLPFQSFRIALTDRSIVSTNSAGETIYPTELTVTDYTVEEGEFFGERRIHVFFRAYDDIGFFQIRLRQDEVHKCVEESIDAYIKQGEDDAKKAGIEKEFTEPLQNNLRNMFEFIMKCVLYITGADADVRWVDEGPALRSQLDRAQSGKKKAKLERRLAHAKRMFLVGHTIVLTRAEKEMYDGISKGLWNLSYRFIVQGHWRNQAYGEDRKLRRLRFIEPYWKGPEFSEVVNNSHLVK